MRQLKWSALAAYLAICVIVYPTLPDRVPFHFGRSGVIDRWADKSPLAWLALPAFMTLLMLLMDLSTNWSMKHPELWNVPEKRRFLAMTDEQRAPVLAELRNLMDVVSLAMVVLFTSIQYMMYQAASAGQTRFPAYFRFVAVAFTVGVIGYTIRFSTRLRRLILSADDRSTIGRMS